MKHTHCKLIVLFLMVVSNVGWGEGQEFRNNNAAGCMAAPMDRDSEVKAIFSMVEAGDVAGIAHYFFDEKDLNVRNARGETLLMVAVEKRNVDSIRALLYFSSQNVPGNSNAVQVDAVNRAGQTALHIAAQFDKIENDGQLILHLLLEAGANPDAVDNRGMTPLAYGVQSNQSYTLRVLLQEGADPEKKIVKGSQSVYEYADNNYNNHAKRKLERWRTRGMLQRGTDALAHMIYEAIEATPVVGRYADTLIYRTGVKPYFDDILSSAAYYVSASGAAVVSTAVIGIVSYKYLHAPERMLLPMYVR